MLYRWKYMQKILSKWWIAKCSSKHSRHRSTTLSPESSERSKELDQFWKTFILVLLLLAMLYFMIFYMNIEENVTKPEENVDINERSQAVEGVTGEITITRNKFSENDTTSELPEQINTQNPNPIFYVPKDGLPWCVTVTVQINNETSNSSIIPEYPKAVNSIDADKAMDMGITMGGHFIPKDCKSKHKVAILVPYRNRRNNLNLFLYYMHPFLIRQNIEYRIFVVEQSGSDPFNKGSLLNAGFLEVQRSDEWQCVVFHDVDLLPADQRIRYTCPVLPRHMAATVVGKERVVKYNTQFGGVTAMTMWHFKKANGFSNLYTEKGESADMFKSDTLSSTDPSQYMKEGLNSVRYSVVSYGSKPLYTLLVLDVNIRRLPSYITETAITLSP